MQLRYVFSETGTGLRRNVSMTVALVVTIFVSLTLVGMGSRMEIWDRERYSALEEATLAQPMPESMRHMVM